MHLETVYALRLHARDSDAAPAPTGHKSSGIRYPDKLSFALFLSDKKTARAMSIVSAVTQESPVVDHLANYLTGNKRAPPFASGNPPQARKPNKPGQSIPGADGKIPASSQTPGKRTNQVIPYGRVGFQEFHRSAGHPEDILPGDVLMLHKTRACLGHDTNRPTKSATWRQINSVLQQAVVVGTNALGDARGRMKSAIIAARQQEMADLNKRRIDQMYNIAEMTRLKQSGVVREKNARVITEKTMQELRNGIKALDKGTKAFSYLPFVDWKAVSMLRDWAPDGVLLNRDDDEQNASYFHAGAGDSGTVLNIGVQGPVALRNVVREPYGTAADDDQMLDPDPWVLDTAYILLVASINKDATGAFVSYTYQFKLSTARIISTLSERIMKSPAVLNDKSGYPTRHCISAYDVAHTVAVWKLGKIMDNKLVTGTYAKMRINVCIEEMHMSVVRSAGGLGLGVGNGHMRSKISVAEWRPAPLPLLLPLRLRLRRPKPRVAPSAEPVANRWPRLPRRRRRKRRRRSLCSRPTTHLKGCGSGQRGLQLSHRGARSISTTGSESSGAHALT